MSETMEAVKAFNNEVRILTALRVIVSALAWRCCALHRDCNHSKFVLRVY